MKLGGSLAALVVAVLVVVGIFTLKIAWRW
jgi:hypothetical protein